MNIKQDTQNVTLNFSIKNSGKYNGDEVAQVYVKFPDQGIKTQLKQLKGFKRVHIKKGATEQISIEIPKEELRLWDDQKKQFYTPSGTYHSWSANLLIISVCKRQRNYNCSIRRQADIINSHLNTVNAEILILNKERYSPHFFIITVRLK